MRRGERRSDSVGEPRVGERRIFEVEETRGDESNWGVEESRAIETELKFWRNGDLTARLGRRRRAELRSVSLSGPFVRRGSCSSTVQGRKVWSILGAGHVTKCRASSFGCDTVN